MSKNPHHFNAIRDCVHHRKSLLRLRPENVVCSWSLSCLARLVDNTAFRVFVILLVWFSTLLDLGAATTLSVISSNLSLAMVHRFGKSDLSCSRIVIDDTKSPNSFVEQRY